MVPKKSYFLSNVTVNHINTKLLECEQEYLRLECQNSCHVRLAADRLCSAEVSRPQGPPAVAQMQPVVMLSASEKPKSPKVAC